MKASKVSATFERKVNLGNYQSATIGVTVWVDLDEGDRASAALDHAQNLCREKVEMEARRVRAVDPLAAHVDHCRK